MNNKRIFLILTVLVTLGCGVVDLNWYPQLSQGDHGRDLYAAQEALRGKLPYKDYWWVYGPLMPYYYAFFYKFFGGTIGSFLLGKLILKATCAAFFYLAAAVWMAPAVAFLAAMWFVQSQQDFFFTFNHIGGIAAELWVLFALFSYIKSPQIRFLWWALPAVLIGCLVKINFGLTSLLVTAITAFSVDKILKIPVDSKKKKFYLASVVGLPVAVLAIYWLLLKDLPWYEVRQCMPYFGDDQPHHFSPSVTLPYYFSQHWLTLVHTWLDVTAIASKPWMSSIVGMITMVAQTLNVFRHVMLHAATVGVLWLLWTGKINRDDRRQLFMVLALLSLFFVVNFHEFVVSGVWYRTFWSLPFLFMFHFIMMAAAFSFIPLLAQRIIWGLLALLLGLGFMVSIFSTNQQKVPAHFLSGPHAQVYIGNEPAWTETVNAVGGFLNQDLKSGELFFALPYDCIYYYLADKESPTRELIFFDHIKLRREQELNVINDLATKNVAYVLMSNRIASSETGLGIFGKTNSVLLSAFIAQSFGPLARQGGDWQAEPGWGHNHGVMILKRK